MPSVAEPRRNRSTHERKRRRAETDIDSTGELPNAKRRKDSPQSDAEVEGDELQVSMRSQQNLRDYGFSDAGRTPEARDKKKRKKKKKKVPVVQQNGSPEKQGSSLPASASPTPKAGSNRASVPKQPTPGPSRLPRSATPTEAIKHEKIQRASTSMSTAVNSVATPSASAFVKGKERAKSVEMTPVLPSPTTNTKVDETLAAELEAHRSLTTTLFPSLICNICLYLMHRPFALSPCGHVACFSCLVNWFTSDAPGQQQNHAEQVAVNFDQPAQNDAPLAANGNANEVAIAAPVPAPAAPAPPLPVPRRKKTCPQCRAIVRSRPVEVWLIKDMVGNVVRSGLADPDSIPPNLREPPTATASAATRSDDEWKDIFPANANRDDLEHLFLAESLGIRDEEDGGVYRCLDCMHEIVDGECSECGRIYPGYQQGFGWDDNSDEDDMDDDLGFMMGFHPNLRYLDGDEDADFHVPVHVTWTEDERDDLSESDGSEEEGYESSFIDDNDDEARDGEQDHQEDNQEDNDDEIEEVPPFAAHRRVRSGHRADPVVISSDEESDGEDARIPRRSSRLIRPTVVESDEDVDEEEDEEEGDSDSYDLATAVAERERELYGDDDSLPHRARNAPRLLGSRELQESSEDEENQ